MTFRPIANRILVRLAEPKAQTAGGLYVPPTAQEKSSEGVVVATGPGRVTESGRLVEPTLRRGDRVLLPKYVGTEIKLDGAPHMIVAEDEILGVLAASDNIG